MKSNDPPVRSLVPRRVGVVFLLVLPVVVGSCGSGPQAAGPEPSRDGDSPAPLNPTGPLPNPGAIAFVRVDPTTVGEGSIPSAELVLLRDGDVEELGVRVSFRSTPAWSPDGGELAFVGPDGLAVTTPQGTSHLLLRCDPDRCTGIGPPAWSPAGTIAFAAELDGEEGLWEIPAAGGDPTLVSGGLAISGAPSFSPFGRSIVAIVDQGRAGQLVVVDARSGEIVARIQPEGLRLGETVAWSPDGTRFLVQASSGGDEGIYVLGADGGDVRLLTSCPDAACVDVGPAWSPDGSQVVFTRGRCDEPGSDCFEGDLAWIPSEGGRVRALVHGPALDCCSAWQPVT